MTTPTLTGDRATVPVDSHAARSEALGAPLARVVPAHRPVLDAGGSFALRARERDRGARVHAHAFMPQPGTPLVRAEPAPIAPDLAAAVVHLESRGGDPTEVLALAIEPATPQTMIIANVCVTAGEKSR